MDPNSLPLDIINLIAVKLNYEDLDSYYSAMRDITPFQLDEMFWLRKTEHDFETQLSGPPNSRESYLEAAAYNCVPLEGTDKYLRCVRDKCIMVYKSAKIGKIELAKKINQLLPVNDKQIGDRLLIIGSIMSGKFSLLPEYQTSRLISEGYYVAASLTNNRESINHLSPLFTEKDIKFLDGIVLILQGNSLKEDLIQAYPEDPIVIITIAILSTIFISEFVSENIIKYLNVNNARYVLLPSAIMITKYGNRRSMEILLKYMGDKINEYVISEEILKEIIGYGNIYTFTPIITDYLRRVSKGKLTAQYKDIALKIATENTDVRMIKLLQNIEV